MAVWRRIKGRTITPPLVRFLRHVDPEPLDRCLLWTGCVNKDGYGRFRPGLRHTRLEYAHRYAWKEAYGDIPSGYTVDHMCKNRACVNLQHLRLVTWEDAWARREAEGG